LRRIEDAPALNDEIATAVAGLDLATALERLTAAGAPVSPVLTADETLENPQLIARDAFKATPGTTPTDSATVAPALGQHDGFAQVS